MLHTAHPWFPGVNTTKSSHDVIGSRESISQQNINGVAPDTNDITDSSTLGKVAFSGYLAYKMFVGIFDIYDVLVNTINVPYTTKQTIPNGNVETTTYNMFGWFAAIIQVGIYCIYIIGFVQYWNKMMLKYAY